MKWFLGFGFAGLFVLYIVLDSMYYEVDNTMKMYKKHLGKKYVLNKDTLLIIDYSIIDNTYKLSNNTKIDADLVRKHLDNSQK